VADCPVCLAKKEDEDTLVSTIKTEDGMVVVPKEHVAILEQTPDDVVGAMFVKANLALLQMFETGIQGANLILNNGVTAGQALPHVALQLVERKENDGLFPLWQPKQLPEDAMNQIQEKMTEAIQNTDAPAEDKPKTESKPQTKNEEKKENAFIRRVFRRVP